MELYLYLYLSSMHLNSNLKSSNVQQSYPWAALTTPIYRIRYSYYHGSTCIALVQCTFQITYMKSTLFRFNFSVKNFVCWRFWTRMWKVCGNLCDWRTEISRSLAAVTHTQHSTAHALQTFIRSNCFPLCFATLILHVHIYLEKL